MDKDGQDVLHSGIHQEGSEVHGVGGTGPIWYLSTHPEEDGGDQFHLYFSALLEEFRQKEDTKDQPEVFDLFSH